MFLKVCCIGKPFGCVISVFACNQMLERRRPFHPRCEDIQVPKFRKGFQNGSVGKVAISIRLVLNKALSDPRRYEDRRNTDTQTVEVKCIIATVSSSFGVC